MPRKGTGRPPGRPKKTAASPLDAARQTRDELRPDSAAAAALSGDEDPSVISMRIADELQGIKPPPPPRPPAPAYPQPDLDDAAGQAHLLATTLIQERQAAAAATAKRVDARRSYKETDRGRVPVETWTQNIKLPNVLAMEDDEGKNLLKRDAKGRLYRGHWVRVREDHNQLNEDRSRVRTMKAFGYEPVMLPDGTPKQTETMVAMQAPVEAEAHRIIYYSRTGAFDTAKKVDALHERADEINTEYSRRHHGAGGGVVGLQTLPEHGTYRGPLQDDG